MDYNDQRHLVKLIGIRAGRRPFSQQLEFESIDGHFKGRLFMDLMVAADEEQCPTALFWEKLTTKCSPSVDVLESVFAQPLVATVEEIKRSNGCALITITDLSLVD
jgi:hypothetical protein